jgi:cold shock protein
MDNAPRLKAGALFVLKNGKIILPQHVFNYFQAGSSCCSWNFVMPRGVRQMPTGVVKWFNEKNGFGFIEMDGTGAEVFLQSSKIAPGGDRALAEGDRVGFEIDEHSRRLQATQVKKLNLTPGAE